MNDYYVLKNYSSLVTRAVELKLHLATVALMIEKNF